MDDAIAWARMIKMSPLLLLHVAFHVPCGAGVGAASCPPWGASSPAREDILGPDINKDEAPAIGKYNLYARALWRRVKEHCKPK
jgi:hypothetical protein